MGLHPISIMSNHPSLRHLYDFSGWVIQEIQVTQKIAVIKLHHGRRQAPRRFVWIWYILTKSIRNDKEPKESALGNKGNVTHRDPN